MSDQKMDVEEQTRDFSGRSDTEYDSEGEGDSMIGYRKVGKDTDLDKHTDDVNEAKGVPKYPTKMMTLGVNVEDYSFSKTPVQDNEENCCVRLHKYSADAQQVRKEDNFKNSKFMRNISLTPEKPNLALQICNVCHSYRWRLMFLAFLLVIIIAGCLVGIMLLNHHDDLRLDHKNLLESLQSELQEQNGKIANQKMLINANSGRLTSMETKYRSVQKQVDEMSNHIKSLEQKIDTNKANITDISNDVRDLKSAVQSLHHSKDKHSQDISGLQRAITQYKNDLDAIKNNIRDLEWKIQRNKQSIRESKLQSNGAYQIKSRMTFVPILVVFISYFKLI